jgi:hypothetical protein
VPQEFIAKEPTLRRSKPPEFVLQGLPPQDSAAQESPSQGSATQESAVQEPAPKGPAKRSGVTAPVRATPASRPATEQRHATKPANGTQASLPAAKKPIRSSQIAKRSTNEALNVVRKFGDSPRDIPVSAYAGNGTRAGGRPGQPLDIRPTSIQDVYYYSVPR